MDVLNLTGRHSAIEWPLLWYHAVLRWLKVVGVTNEVVGPTKNCNTCCKSLLWQSSSQRWRTDSRRNVIMDKSLGEFWTSSSRYWNSSIAPNLSQWKVNGTELPSLGVSKTGRPLAASSMCMSMKKLARVRPVHGIILYAELGQGLAFCKPWPRHVSICPSK